MVELGLDRDQTGEDGRRSEVARSGDERLLRTSRRLDQSPDDGMMALAR